MDFRILGPLEALADGRRVALGGIKPRSLLTALLLERGKVVPAARLIDVIWGEQPPDSAKALIQTYVFSLRQAFAKHGREDLIRTEPPGYLVPTDTSTLDSDLFETRVAQAWRYAGAGDHEQAAALYRQAESLWRGPALAGLEHSLLAGEGRRLEEMRVAAMEERIAAELNLGRMDQLIPELTALVGHHPTNERLRGQLMLALFRSGRQADALASFRAGRDLLVAELGVEPGEDLSTLHGSILRGDPGLLGTRRVPATPTGARPAQLPLAPLDFTGRLDDVTRLCEALSEPSPLLQVITGPGGGGKSALAAHVAHRVAASFPDGQLYVELRGMSGVPAAAGEVLGRFLRALGTQPVELPESAEEKGELFRTLMYGRRMLLVLDDVASVAQVRQLLPGEPSCGILVTSRDRLAGLPGSELTELGLFGHDEAMQLLGRLAGPHRVAAEPDAAERIIAACQHLPLAIRIAGARLASRRRLPVAVLAGRLTDEARRLDELAVGDLGVRASIALSYEGLSEPARIVLRRLGYLGSPNFSAWMVAWLTGGTAEAAEAAVEQLVDAQLIEFAGVSKTSSYRYRVHDLVRIFSCERAVAEEDAAALPEVVRRALGGWLSILDSVEAESPPAEIRRELHGIPRYPLEKSVVSQVLSDPQAWLAEEESALVVAVERAACLGLHQVAYEFVATRNSLVFDINRFDVRARIVDAALAACRDGGDALGEGIMLAELARLRYEQDDFVLARRYYNEAMSRLRETKDLPGQAAALAGLGIACREPGHLAEALHYLEQAIAVLSTLEDDAGMGYVRRLAGSVHLELGNYAEADAALAAAMRAYERCGSSRGRAFTLRTLGLYHRARREYPQAAEACAEAVELFRAANDEFMLAYSVRALAKTQLRQGLVEQALGPLEWVLSVVQAKDDRWGSGVTLRSLGEVHLEAGRLELAETCLLAALEVWTSLQSPLWRARTLRDLALTYRAQGHRDRAEPLWTEMLQIFRTTGAREFDELNTSTPRVEDDL